MIRFMKNTFALRFPALVLSVLLVGAVDSAQVRLQAQEKPNEFRQVSPLVYAGGKPTAADLEYLRSLGIKIIINLQGGNYTSWTAANLGVAKIQPGEAPESIKFETDLAGCLGMSELNFPMSSLWVTGVCSLPKWC